MEPSGGHIDRLLSHGDAAQILKEMLNVGKPQSHSQNQSPNGDGGFAGAELPSPISRSDPSIMSAKPSQSAKNLLPDTDKLTELMSFGGTVTQHIALEGDDRGGSVTVYGREVAITPSKASHLDSSIPGSNKVKITPVVNYDWEAKYYFGNLVAVNSTYLVYVLKIQSGYGLRILNRQSTVRALLKGFSHIITDIAFASHNADILGCIDLCGNLSVWEISEGDGKISYEPKLRVQRGLPASEYHRLVWCPYLPDEMAEEEIPNEWSSLLAVSHGEKAELWDISVVAGEYPTDENQEVKYEGVQNGLIKIDNGHIKPITDMAVSPDGSVLASASLDGMVKFWQMYWECDDPPRCLHQFSPHEGAPVMSLLFCDNHKHQDASLPFWRFLITGADYNCELKVWCTVQWSCLQTIRFGSGPNDPQPCLRVKLDLSASFLMATDIGRKVLYVVQLFQDHEEGRAHFSSLTEFLLSQRMLSFAIVDAGRCRSKQSMDDAEEGEDIQPGDYEVTQDGEDGERGTGGQPVSILVKMFCVFQRALQELQVRFQPSPSVNQEILAGSINTTTSHGDNTLRDGLSDVSFSATERSVTSTDTDPPTMDPMPIASPRSQDTSSFSSESPHSSTQPYLVTPEALMNSSRSPSKASPGMQPHSLLRDSASSTASSSFTHITGTNISVDDLLSSCATASSPVTPDSSVTLTPTPASNHMSPLAAQTAPLPGSGQASRPFMGELGEEEDEGPKSPPPSPVEGGIIDLKGDPLQGSSDNIAELLEKSALIKEKRLSDSSAEVAQILGTNVNEEEDNNEEEGDVVFEQDKDDEDDDDGDGDDEEEDDVEHVEPDTEKDGMDQNGEKIENSLSSAMQDANLQNQDAMNGYSSLPARTENPVGGGDAHDISINHEVGSERSSISQGSREQEGRVEKSQQFEGRGMMIDPNKYQQDMGQIMTNLEGMMALLQTQQQEIKHLRQEMSKAQLSNSIIQSTKARIDKLEKGLGTKLDTMFAKQSQEERQRLTTALQEKTNLDKQKQERLLETVTQTLRTQITSKLDKTVRQEIENKVVPEMQRVIGPLSDNLNTAIGQKLTATDQLMRENITKLVKSKGVAETMGQAAANSLSSTIHNTYRDAFHSTVVPAFERACSSMFEQINTSFESGTREYVTQLEANLAKLKQKQQEARDPILKEMRSLVETQRTSSDALKASFLKDVQGEMSEQLHTSNDRLKTEVLEKVQRMVREEISLAMEKHQAVLQEDVMAALRSQAPTPVPQAPDIHQVQAKIKQLLEQKQVNAAFQHALNASDLRVVVFTCSEVTPDAIFTDDGCLLEQPVLLSLIQQLSQDLANQTKIKCTYIDEALLAVDTTFPVTRDHLTGIVMELCRQITIVLQSAPNHPQTKQLKRVLMQAQSLK